MRYFLELAYDGTAYHGWQLQHNAHSVQAELNAALRTVLRQPVDTVGSGRTDTGVHAQQQFVHFDLPDTLPDPPALVRRLNAVLPPDLAVRSIFAVPATAHARFDATSRKYEYRLRTTKDAFHPRQCYYYAPPLDVPAMNAAAVLLLAHEEFACFSKVHTDVRHFRCRVTDAQWRQDGELRTFHIRADRFLRGMVRAIVGTLLRVGSGQCTTDNFAAILQSGDRQRAGAAVPPHGLFLTEVCYPALLLVDRPA